MERQPFFLTIFIQIRSLENTVKKKLPVLGTIFPFFFSRDVKIDIEKDILIILTPKVRETVAETIPEQFRAIQKIDK